MRDYCPFCNSQSVRYDRVLAGRPVCGSCGMPLSKTRQIRWPASVRSIINKRIGRPATKTLVALLLPIGLVSSYLYMWSNPSSMMRWLAPFSPAAREGWVIKTPADIELMISQAQKNQTSPYDPNFENTIRILAQVLQSKGIQLVVTDHITPGAGGEWDTTRGELRIRPSTVAMGIPVLANALAHESTHVAQSCRAGGVGKKVLLLVSRWILSMYISGNLICPYIEDLFSIKRPNLRRIVLALFHHGRSRWWIIFARVEKSSELLSYANYLQHTLHLKFQ